MNVCTGQLVIVDENYWDLKECVSVWFITNTAIRHDNPLYKCEQSCNINVQHDSLVGTCAPYIILLKSAKLSFYERHTDFL